MSDESNLSPGVVAELAQEGASQADALPNFFHDILVYDGSDSLSAKETAKDIKGRAFHECLWLLVDDVFPEVLRA